MTAPPTRPVWAPTPSSASPWPAPSAAATALNMPLYNYIGGVNAKTLPVPMMNILNGGAHATNNVDIQEFMVMPVGATSWKEALRMCAEVFHTLKSVLKANGTPAAGVGDEGGYAPNLKKDEDAFKCIVKAIEEAGYKPGEDFMLAIDAAVSDWYNPEDGTYTLPKAKKTMTRQQMVNMWKKFADNYPIISMEDCMGEDDWEGWAMLTKALGDHVQLVGDDLFVTNVDRVKMGLEKHVANAVLIKVNQIGTLTETLDTMQLANRAGYTTIVSPPLRRDRGHHHRRPRRGPERRPDQDRRPQPHRPRLQVQPAAPHRGGAVRRRQVRRQGRLLQPEEVSFKPTE